jgi:L-fucose mutarotase
MLKTIDPLLTPDLLWALAAMGHGDDIALVDANHPAERIARTTTFGRPIRLPGIPVERAAAAILSVLPIDDFEPQPLRRMEVVGEPAAIPPPQQAVRALLGEGQALHGIERFAFYEAAGRAFAVVQAGDPRPYGCFLFRKGVIAG